MKKTFAATAIVLVLVMTAVASERRDDDIDRIQTASVVLKQIMSAPDSAIPDSIMSGAKCIAIMPSMLKGGFIFGANYGKGVATCRTETGWSAPAFFKLTGGSFGFQAGGQASDLVLIIRTDDGMQYLLHSKFKLGADASAAAGPVGRDAQAMTDLTLRAQVLTYSRSRGLFLGVSLGGGVIKQDDADTQAFYGKTWTYRSLLNGQVPAPTDAQPFLQAVEKYAPTPRPHVPPTVSTTPSVTAPTASAAPVVATPTPSAEATTVASSSAAPQPAAEPVAAAAQSTPTADDPATTPPTAATQLR
ncbi:MAG: lipid-binding SYLF domain-containing protein [Terriglobales bacterium]